MNIPNIKPDLPTLEQVSKEFGEILSNGKITNFGKYVTMFEELAGSYLGTHTATISSGTMGLLFALQSVGVKPGQKVIIPSFHKKKVTGSEGMIGLEGEVIEPLTPVGVIMVSGEYWKAKSVDEDIPAGEEVEILGLAELTLTVRLKDR